MKNMKNIMLILLIASGVSAFAQDSQVRDVPSFTEVSFNISGVAYITQGSQESVILKGVDLDEIKTEVKNGKLVIRNTSNKKFQLFNREEDLEVHITMPTVEGLSVSGSGKIYGKNMIKAEKMDLKVSGSGNIELEADAKVLRFSIAGSGLLKVAGTATDGYASISGSGNIKAVDLKAQKFEVKISGSGNCEIYARESLEASISGSGTIYYKGDPKKVNVNTSGSGSIKKI